MGSEPRTRPGTSRSPRVGRRIVVPLVAALAGACAGPGPVERPEAAGTREAPHEFVELVMASPARITIWSETSSGAREAARAALDRMHAVESTISSWRADSWTARLVAAAPGSLEVPDDLGTALRVGTEVHQASGGAFDLTVGPMMELWRRSREEGVLPGEAALEDARARRAMDAIELEGLRARIGRTGILLDFGGIGKGLATWRAGKVLRERGIDRFLIDFDGEILAGDPPPGRDSWVVAIAAVEPASPLLVATSGCSISTSGDLHQYLVVDGIRYGHVMDPRTGLGVREGRQVTVITEEPDGIGDALATAGCLLEFPVFERLLRERYPGTSAVVQRRRGDRTIIRTIGDPPVRAPEAP
ncbi:MAG: FAD:protein FMN transferase [Planctomycetota bacterium]|nr:FAD:protein FMN transferase [Planctomycetota bacterium]